MNTSKVVYYDTFASTRLCEIFFRQVASNIIKEE